ncbi:oligopeptide/dipeptide ABC transporter ATP-binding protein [Bradyrhizobium sp. ORS 375]|uniref:ABC transporter ATP-binding protein n=1 Tax=Bradyrhizobium sp. (strain ORS 375) TaxID=566679 RepID=UPI0002F16A70|nr:oligopeptide/dipeptide ABC transporter ATP-binding protein [Bradyrhizobium sp. ORS 375]
MSIPILSIRGVTKRFTLAQGLFRSPATLNAVNGIDLDIAEGEIVGIVGESGCGKSTLGRIVTGLMRLSEGAVRFRGQDITAIERRELARLVQPIFQDPYSSLNPRRSIAATVAEPLEIHGIGDRSERMDKAVAMLDRVGLPSRFASNVPSQLSGGQRQRVAIARALILNPQLIVCDEPTSALDVSVQSQILNLLMELRRDFRLTYLFISHNLAVVEHIADRVGVMYLGRMVEVAPSANLFAKPQHPYTRALLHSVLSPEPGAGVPDIGLKGGFPDPTNPPSGCVFHPRCPIAVHECAKRDPALMPANGGVAACHLIDPDFLEAPARVA